MKTGILSIILALIGLLIINWHYYQVFEIYQTELIKMQRNSILSPVIVTSSKLIKLIGICFGLFGLLFGIKSRKNIGGKIGIILSIITIIVSIIPIWTFFIKE